MQQTDWPKVTYLFWWFVISSLHMGLIVLVGLLIWPPNQLVSCPNTLAEEVLQQFLYFESRMGFVEFNSLPLSISITASGSWTSFSSWLIYLFNLLNGPLIFSCLCRSCTACACVASRGWHFPHTVWHACFFSYFWLKRQQLPLLVIWNCAPVRGRRRLVFLFVVVNFWWMH